MNAGDEDGQTPLIKACEESPNVVLVLLDAGAAQWNIRL